VLCRGGRKTRTLLRTNHQLLDHSLNKGKKCCYQCTSLRIESQFRAVEFEDSEERPRGAECVDEIFCEHVALRTCQKEVEAALILICLPLLSPEATSKCERSVSHLILQSTNEENRRAHHPRMIATIGSVGRCGVTTLFPRVYFRYTPPQVRLVLAGRALREPRSAAREGSKSSELWALGGPVLGGTFGAHWHNCCTVSCGVSRLRGAALSTSMWRSRLCSQVNLL